MVQTLLRASPRTKAPARIQPSQRPQIGGVRATAHGTPLLQSYIRRMLLEESAEGLDWFARIVADGAQDCAAGNATAWPADRRTSKASQQFSTSWRSYAACYRGTWSTCWAAGDGPGRACTGRWRDATSELLRSPSTRVAAAGRTGGAGNPTRRGAEQLNIFYPAVKFPSRPDVGRRGDESQMRLAGKVALVTGETRGIGRGSWRCWLGGRRGRLHRPVAGQGP